MPAIPSLGKLCSEQGCSYEWKNGVTPRLTQHEKTITCTMDNSRPLVVPGFSSSSSSNLFSTSRSKDQSNYFRKLRKRIRSSNNSKWQALHAGKRRWQIMTRRPRWTVNQLTRWTRSIQGKLQPFKVNPEVLEAHVLARSSERENPDSEGDASKVETQKRQHSVHAYRFPRTEKVWWLDISTAQSPQRKTWISEQSPIRCRGTSSRTLAESFSNKNFTRDGEEFTKVLIAVAEAKSYSYVQFIRIWQELWRSIMESSNVCTSSLTKKRNCRTSFSTSKIGNISCVIAIQIGWKEEVRIYGMLLLSAKCPRPTGKLSTNEDLENLPKHWRNTLQSSERDKARIHQFGKKVWPRIYALSAGGIWKGDILVADIEELEELDASEIFPRRLNAKEVLITPQRRRTCKSCGRWFSNIIRRRLRIPRTHSGTEIHRKDRESQRRISRREGRVSTWRKKRWRGNSGIIMVFSRRLYLPSTCWTEGSIVRAERRIIPRKAKTSEAKTNSIMFTLQGKDGIRLCRSISQRRMPRENEKYELKIFHPKKCWFQMQRQ